MRAVQLVAASEKVRQEAGIAVRPTSRDHYEGFTARLRQQLDHAQFDRAWAAGEQMTQQEALDYALSIY